MPNEQYHDENELHFN